jgi:uncharacterized membrane protein YfcA
MIELGGLSPWLLLVAPLVMVLGYVVFGLTGFGATAVTVPVLAHFLPVTFLVPMVALIDLGSSIAVGSAARAHLSKEELKRLLPWMFVGFFLGVTVLVGVPERHLRLALGIFAALMGLYGILNPRLVDTISRLWAVPAGIVGGSIATIFGAGGPVYAAYLSGRLADKSQIRSTTATLISISSLVRALLYAATGLLLHGAVFAGAAVLAPFAWAGVKIGHRIHVGLSQEQMRRCVGALLVLIGASLLVRALS